MLLSNFKKVEEIDGRIVRIHRELAELYEQRYFLIDGGHGLSTATHNDKSVSISLTTDSSEQEYRKVASAWERYNLILPGFGKVKAKFSQAKKIRSNLEKNYPEIVKSMIVLAVPPSKLLRLPVDTELRDLQGLNIMPDFISSTVSANKAQAAWEFLLVFNADESLPVGTAKKLRSLKGYMIAGYDTSGLGVREYSALTLQTNRILDTNTSTLLLRSNLGKNSVAYACFRQGRYRIEAEDEDNVLEDDGFRPAIKL